MDLDSLCFRFDLFVSGQSYCDHAVGIMSVSFAAFDGDRELDAFFVFGAGSFSENVVAVGFVRIAIGGTVHFEVEKIADDIEFKVAVAASGAGNFNDHIVVIDFGFPSGVKDRTAEQTGTRFDETAEERSDKFIHAGENFFEFSRHLMFAFSQ
jgi:hypothetical protein